MEYFKAVVIWVDEYTHEAAVLIEGRESTTLVFGIPGLSPGQEVIVYLDGQVRPLEAV